MIVRINVTGGLEELDELVVVSFFQLAAARFLASLPFVGDILDYEIVQEVIGCV